MPAASSVVPERCAPCSLTAPLLLATALLLAPATAHADPDHHDVAAGGVVFSPAWLPNVGPNRDYSAGLLGCIGGQGFEIDGIGRAGGELHFCAGDGGMMALGGAQGGLAVHPGPLLASATLTGGGGFLRVESSRAPTWSTAFLYVKPTASVGLGLGWFGVELGVFTEVGLPVVQWVEEDLPAGGPFVTSGGQVSLLFGEFWPHETRRAAPPPRSDWTPVQTEPPLAIPPESPPPSQPPAGWTAVPPDGTQPLEAELEASIAELERAVRDLSGKLAAAGETAGASSEAAAAAALEEAEVALDEARAALDEARAAEETAPPAEERAPPAEED